MIWRWVLLRIRASRKKRAGVLVHCGARHPVVASVRDGYTA